MTMMNQSQYAQHSGVDRKTIGRWIKAGRFIVMDGDLIDVDASDAALKKNRDGKDPRASNAKKKKTPTVVDDVGDEIEDTARKIILTEGADLTREEAARVRENYMALLAKLQYEKDSGQTIELVAAEEILFNAFRQQRDAWMNWPSRVAPLIAADLGVPADRMTEVLIEHVHKHISVLGEPEFNSAED
ncbi:MULTISPECIES: hypothetical protein [Klebsiella/Raoultella group]|uniref:hypothetical protein n=1 Tax=Klebsiella/Raoultella group TaxID=2890311 RepID=UPI000F4BA321|nr:MULTISPECIES: hypothetical protein [Klebsiella/Raoultella group]VUD31984.1 Uncharacterised protein [Raoultella sp. NCTC 9187]HDT6528050.1 hypothetical protein [Raoultella ornithinolytica]MBX4661160.1 hypothetical protein [Klebsiella michiganensis]QLO78697.1 hypothetical protein HV306_17030 [Klebsiella grimontii]ROS15870.1 hypothetical protein EDF82_0979 [Raoultella sp. BIGb0399]